MPTNAATPASGCQAVQYSDLMSCACGNRWDVNDPHPPACMAALLGSPQDDAAAAAQLHAVIEALDDARKKGLSTEMTAAAAIHAYRGAV